MIQKPTSGFFLILMMLALGSCASARHDSAGPVPCDILIAGGSFGGCAAAIASSGLDVWMVEDSPWIGGQVTSQGVSALDEHPYIEKFGGTKTYMDFRRGVRDRYLHKPRASPSNPGGGWVSRLCFEPREGLAVLQQMTSGARILCNATIIAAKTGGDRVEEVTIQKEDGSIIKLAPRYILDATDTGSFLELAGVEYRRGADSRAETGEPHAALSADPAKLQSFTWVFAVEYDKNGRHTVEKPRGYETFRDTQPYSLQLPTASGTILNFGFFEHRKETPGSFWRYRRLTPDIAMINWPGNDYRGTPLLEADHDEAKRLSLGFLYWLQTECPRDDGGFGYPELKLRADVMGTTDGLSMRPYVREGRRLEALATIVEQDVTEGDARARLFHDTIGVGLYPIDMHSCSGDRMERGGAAIPTKPFQIPLRSIIPKRVRNVLAAGKCLGVTHITNGCYRLHPVEWNTGESAGHTAAFCIERGVEPRDIPSDPGLLAALQRRLLERGIPIFWYIDLVAGTPLFTAAQLATVSGAVPPDPGRLEFGSDPIRIQAALNALDPPAAATEHK